MLSLLTHDLHPLEPETDYYAIGSRDRVDNVFALFGATQTEDVCLNF